MNQQKISRIPDFILLIFFICTLVQLPLFVFPWFTFDREIMGHYSGLLSVHLFAVQYGYIFYYLWRYCTKGKTCIWSILGMEAALILLVLAMRRVFFTWTAPMNISATISAEASLHTAQPCFWVTTALIAASVLLYQAFLIANFLERKALCSSTSCSERCFGQT